MKSFFKKNKKIFLSIVFLLLLITITFFVIFKNYDIKLLFNTLRNVKVIYIILALLMVFIYLIFESLSTRSILKNLNEKTNFINNFKYTCVDYYYCYITPSASGGQPMVGYYMAKDNVKIENISICLLFNTLQFKIVLLFLGILAMIITPSFIFSNGLLLIILFFIGFILNIGMVILCFMGIYADRKLTKIGFTVINFFKKLKIIRSKEKWQLKLVKKMRKYKESSELLSNHKSLFGVSFFYNLIQRIAMFSVGFFVYLALNQNDLSLINLISIQVIIALSVDTLPLPGGVLITETLMLMLYKLIYIDSLIMPAMLITRAISYYFCLLFTLFIIIIFHIIKMFKNKKYKKIKESSYDESIE